MIFFLALLLLVHAVAHLPGFIVGWNLTALEALPYRTVIAGDVDVGVAGMRIVGALWLSAAALFSAASLGVMSRSDWWYLCATAGVVLSLVLCVAQLPETRLGLGMNVVIIAAMLFLRARTAPITI